MQPHELFRQTLVDIYGDGALTKFANEYGMAYRHVKRLANGSRQGLSERLWTWLAMRQHLGKPPQQLQSYKSLESVLSKGDSHLS